MVTLRHCIYNNMKHHKLWCFMLLLWFITKPMTFQMHNIELKLKLLDFISQYIAIQLASIFNANQILNLFENNWMFMSQTKKMSLTFFYVKQRLLYFVWLCQSTFEYLHIQYIIFYNFTAYLFKITNKVWFLLLYLLCIT